MPRRFLLLLAVLTLIPSVSAESRPEGAAGFPAVVAGDMLRLGNRHIRLNGIRSPHPGMICRAGDVTYHCGDAARQLLERVIADFPVSCEGVSAHRVYPAPMVCRLGRQDLNLFMLHRGYAVVDRASCGDSCIRYHKISNRAKAAKRGVWQGDELPNELRRYTLPPTELAETERDKPASAFGGWWH